VGAGVLCLVLLQRHDDKVEGGLARLPLLLLCVGEKRCGGGKGEDESREGGRK
jgi:hypothetical protein